MKVASQAPMASEVMGASRQGEWLMNDVRAAGVGDRVFTKAKLMEYITRMCTEERNKCEDDRVDIDEPPPKNNANKDTIVSFLVKWRSIIFEKNPEMKQQLIDKMQAGFAQQSFSSEASRMALMDDTFFKLSPSVLQRERYTGVIFN